MELGRQAVVLQGHDLLERQLHLGLVRDGRGFAGLGHGLDPGRFDGRGGGEVESEQTGGEGQGEESLGGFHKAPFG